MADAPKKTITLQSIQLATNDAIDWRDGVIRRAENLRRDPYRRQRLAGCECIACRYLRVPRVFKECERRFCGACNKQIGFSHTDVPKLCLECAKKYRLCRQCGATIDLRERRKFEVGGPS